MVRMLSYQRFQALHCRTFLTLLEKIMTIKEFEKNLNKIDSHLLLVSKENKPLLIFFHDMPTGDLDIYDFETNEYNLSNCHKSLVDAKADALVTLINSYISNPNDSNNKGGLATESAKKNPFAEYTDHLAETLQEKNGAYGDSFTKSVDKYGLSVIGVRLSDKYNRIEHLITHNELKENDESLEDTLLDMAGYSILGLKYLKEHENEGN